MEKSKEEGRTYLGIMRRRCTAVPTKKRRGLVLDEVCGMSDRPEATFMLRVDDDSMIDSDILPGDTVLVERGRTPRNGDIVIAYVDGAWTMNYFFKDGKGIRLEPANKKYKTIRPKSRLAVEGVVSSVIRKLV